jgi:hypothetical protein
MFIASRSFLLFKLHRSAIDSSLTSVLLQGFAAERHHLYERCYNISLLWSEDYFHSQSKQQTAELLLCCLPSTAYGLVYRFLLRVHSQIPHQKRIDIRGLLDRFRRVAGAVTGLRIDANQDRVTSSLRRLEHRRVLEIMRRHYSIVMIGGCYKCCRILRAWLDVMNR